MSFPSSADATALPPPGSLAIHLDLVGGLAGDMFVAALVDALPALGPLVLSELVAMEPEGGSSAAFQETTIGALRARRFGAEELRSPAYARVKPRRSGVAALRTAGHAGTAYSALRRRIDRSALTPPTRTHALALLDLLAAAEARVHGIAIDAVHFHELADWDSLMDVVAAGCIAGTLEGAHWTASAPPLGSGTVQTAHGLLPVPAPATTLLLAGYPWHDDGIGGERVTPTGAAILRHLVAAGDCEGRRDGGRLLACGYGAGTRALDGAPNVVRALVLDRSPVGDADADADVVSVIEFDVDDMTGEEIAHAADRLRAGDGVIDVSLGTRHGKKGRVVTEFRLLTAPDAAEAIAGACFSETSTLGLRMRDERRRVLRRTEVATKVGAAALDVKLALRPDGKRTAKAAHDAVVTTPGLAARRRLRAAAVTRALEARDE